MSEFDTNVISKQYGKKKFDVAHFVIALVLCLWGVVILYPFYNAFLMSITSYGSYVKSPFMLWPRELDLSSYTFIFNYPLILSGLRTTTIVLVVGVTYNLFLTVTMSYAMSKKIPGISAVNAYVVFTMFFSGGLIPGYMLIMNLGLINSIFSMILPAGISTFNLFIMRSYFKTIPEDLAEAAYLDGAGEMTILTRIYIPLAMPMLATVGLFYAVDRWNEWYNGMLYIRSASKQPLQLVIRNILQSVNDVTNAIPVDARPTAFPDGIQMAAVLIAMAPVVIIYPFLQKYFVAGMTLGGVKG